jgi:nucleobase:cation symporter-1, NCS1 family
MMDGADLSLFIGLPVTGGLYLLLARSLDVEGERRLAEREAEELEEMAHEHALPTASR